MDKTKTLTRPAGATRIRTFLEPHGFNIEVVDYFSHFSIDELKQVCAKYITKDTLFVGISITFLYDFEKINTLFKHVKETYPGVQTLIGGNESALAGLDTALVDRIIWGYAEEAVLHYLKYITGKRLDNLQWVPYRETLAVNAEEFYKNDDTDLTIKWLPEDQIKFNFLPVEISRGCIFRCTFCQFPLLGKKKNDYIRHKGNLADEFKRNYEMWGITNYTFQDDTFNDNIVKLEYVAEAIAQSGVQLTYSAFLRADLMARYPETISMLADTGLIAGTFGIESFHPEAKKAIGKGMDTERQLDAVRQLKKNRDIYTYTGMIVGLPGESLKSILDSQQWFIDQNFEVFDKWEWFGLVLRKNAMTRLSEFEKNYEKWDYTTKDAETVDKGTFKKDIDIVNWKNKFMDVDTALAIAKQLNKETDQYRKKFGKVIHNWNDGVTAMWEVSEIVGLGIDIKDVINGTFDKTLFGNKIKEVYAAIETYKKSKLTPFDTLVK
jgi:hypothetical protein